jgi:glutamyl-tRNA synthetase
MHPHRLTRIAPTPSGFLHPGNVLSFAITARLAQLAGAQTLLRVDDMDRERVLPEYVQDIFDTLRLVDIPWQQGPQDYHQFTETFSQHHRMPLYNYALQQLWREGRVYACTCSRADVARTGGIYNGACRHKALPPNTPDACWRMNTDDAHLVTIKTLSGPISVPFPADMAHYVVRRRDGLPAYQLSSVVDDVHFGVDLVVRGQDLFSSTVAQLYLAQCMGDTAFSAVTFYHHQLVAGADGQKLSKSAGALSVRQLSRGYTQAAGVYEAIAALTSSTPVTDWRAIGDLYLSDVL